MKCKAYKKQCVALAGRAVHAQRRFLTCAAARVHRRLRALTQKPAPHSQRDAELAAGMAAPDNGPRLRG
jgi:hypothetical protein